MNEVIKKHKLRKRLPLAAALGTGLALALLQAPVQAPVRAQEYRVKSGEPIPSSDAAGQTWLIRDRDCRLLRRHVPAADVAHRPHDGDGVPTDLNPGPDFDDRARNFAFAVTVVTDDYLPPVGPYGQSGGGEGFLGFVEVRDGVPYMDGQPLDGLVADEVAAACNPAK
jgi:hypothetical protein